MKFDIFSKRFRYFESNHKKINFFFVFIWINLCLKWTRFFSIFMIVNFIFICSMKLFWFVTLSSRFMSIFIFYERKTVFYTSVIKFVINWEWDDFDSKINRLSILTIDWISEIANNWSTLSNVRLFDCFVRCLREDILSIIYRFNEKSDIYIKWATARII